MAASGSSRFSASASDRIGEGGGGHPPRIIRRHRDDAFPGPVDGRAPFVDRTPARRQPRPRTRRRTRPAVAPEPADLSETVAPISEADEPPASSGFVPPATNFAEESVSDFAPEPSPTLLETGSDPTRRFCRKRPTGPRFSLRDRRFRRAPRERPRRLARIRSDRRPGNPVERLRFHGHDPVRIRIFSPSRPAAARIGTRRRIRGSDSVGTARPSGGRGSRPPIDRPRSRPFRGRMMLPRPLFPMDSSRRRCPPRSRRSPHGKVPLGGHPRPDPGRRRPRAG